MDSSRLGHEQRDVPCLEATGEGGGRVFYYLGDKDCKLDSAAHEFLPQADALANEIERERARLRMHDELPRQV